jgi:surface antigen
MSELSPKPGRAIRYLVSVVGVLVGTAGVLPSAYAQRVYLNGLHGAHMSPQDMQGFRAGAQKLLDHQPAHVGQTQSWTGQSGMHGTMTILRIFTKSNLPCRDFRSTFVSNNSDHRRPYDFTVCRTANGDWKLAY